MKASGALRFSSAAMDVSLACSIVASAVMIAALIYFR
jgi:hypothetical protein